MEALEELSKNNKDTRFQMVFGFQLAAPINGLNARQVKTIINKFTKGLSLLDETLAVVPTWQVVEDSKVNRELLEKLNAKAEARQKLAESAQEAKQALAQGLKQGV